MDIVSHYYQCSQEYVEYLDVNLYEEVINAIDKLRRRKTQAEINQDLFWILTNKGWEYDSSPAGIGTEPPKDLLLEKVSLADVKKNNNRKLCKTSTTLNADWHADFAKMLNGSLIQIQVQFGKVELMFKDFCGFRIAYGEKRLKLGIEVVMADPARYFAHRKSAISGMANFNIALSTIASIGLDCPIWLIGLKE